MWSIFSRDPTSSFPYELGEAVGPEDHKTIWKLHRGKKKQNGEEVSLFICNEPTYLDIAKSAVKRLKTLRHPCILMYIDSLESDKLVYLVTEPVTPLQLWLKNSSLSSTHRTTTISWGLLQVTKGLSFLNNDGGLIHYNVSGNSVFVNRGGEWKLGSVEYASSESGTFPQKVLPRLDVYNPPEMVDPSKMRTTTKWSADMWGLGCLIWEVFNGPLHQSFDLQNTAEIPNELIPTYKRLVGASPQSRPNPRDVIDNLRKPGQFFNNDLIETLLYLEEIQIKDANEKHKFFSQLTPKLDNIPDFITTNKILPAVLAAHEFSNVGSVVLSPLFKIGKLLDEQEYQKQILPSVVKLFSSSDRATRLKLLQQVEVLAEHMNPQTVNDQVFQQLATGFLDTNPTIREHTVKSIMFLASKLNYNNLNIEVLKHFARLQSKDDQGGIRTNTTVCLGKIAMHLHPDVRQKCLISAFTRATRDPFPPARIAGVMAFAATQQYFPVQDVATKILPSLCQLTLDPEKNVRDNVFRVLKGFLSKIEKVSEDPTLKEQMEAEVKSFSSSNSQPASWAGWAVGALASKFYKSSISTPSQQPQSQLSTSSSGTVTPSTKTSSLASTPSQDHSRASSRTATSQVMNDDDKSDSEEWEGQEWKSMDSLPATKATTVSEALADTGRNVEGEDGWEDEEWGSLEETLASENISDEKTKVNASLASPDVKSTATYGWATSPGTDSDDFFNSIISDRAPVAKTSSRSRTTISPSSNTGTTSWDSWDDSTSGFNNDSESKSKAEDQRRQREEKKLQRQKEIEARRAARAGPMKLGAKKI